MTQPFRSGRGCYISALWPGVRVSLDPEQDHIVLESPCLLDVLSSAVYGGGFGCASHLVNWKVPRTYRCSDPEQDMVKRIEAWGYPPGASVGFITAAKLTHTSIVEAEGDCFSIVCCSTAGTGNAARAGSSRDTFPAYRPVGTINTFVLIDGRMSPSAMVNAVITATEAKAAALADLNIVDPVSGSAATGTTTDAIVIGVSQSAQYAELHAYAGTATTIGDLIGRCVYQTVYEAAATQHDE